MFREEVNSSVQSVPRYLFSRALPARPLHRALSRLVVVSRALSTAFTSFLRIPDGTGRKIIR